MCEKRVVIYLDLGVCKESAAQIGQAVSQITNSSPRFIDAKELLRGKWILDTSCFIMPGGRDLFYHKALFPKGTALLRDFVENGGTYIGICAGAYFASASIEFEKGGALEVVGQRDLQFFPGIAIGPAYGLGEFNYKERKGARISILDCFSQKIAVYYHGGCLFFKAEEYSGVEIVARYDDISGKPAAIIRCSRKKGQAWLSGVHCEYPKEHQALHSLSFPTGYLDQIKGDRYRSDLFKKILMTIPGK